MSLLHVPPRLRLWGHGAPSESVPKLLHLTLLDDTVNLCFVESDVNFTRRMGERSGGKRPDYRYFPDGGHDGLGTKQVKRDLQSGSWAKKDRHVTEVRVSTLPAQTSASYLWAFMLNTDG